MYVTALDDSFCDGGRVVAVRDGVLCDLELEIKVLGLIVDERKKKRID